MFQDSEKYWARIFIPHDCADHAILKVVDKSLRVIGVKPIYRCENNRVRPPSEREIRRLINKCSFVCPILTRRAARNPSVVAQYAYAVSRRKKLAALVQDRARLSSVLQHRKLIRLDPTNPSSAAHELGASLLREQALQTKTVRHLALALNVAAGFTSIFFPSTSGFLMLIESLLSAFEDIVNSIATKRQRSGDLA